MENLFIAAKVTAGIAAVAALFFYFTQSRLLYYPNLPSRELTASPQDIGLPYEEVRFSTSDGKELHGWFIDATKSHESSRETSPVTVAGTLLFFHGNAGNVSHRLDSIRIFHQLGLAVFIFDYRGYGQSSGNPSEAGTYLDAQAALRYLTRERQIPPSDIVYFGRSLGAAIASHLARQQTPRALILESAFTSVPDMAARLFPWLPARWLSRFAYSNIENLQSIACPVLIVHSPDDEIIPFSHGRQLYAAAKEPKSFLQIRGGHNDGFYVSGALYTDGLRDFLAPLL